jgi:hypothetical protein
MKIAILLASMTLALTARAQSTSAPLTITNVAGQAFTITVPADLETNNALYTWSCNGTTIVQTTDPSFSTSFGASYSGTNTYSVEITDAPGTTNFTEEVITVASPTIQQFTQTQNGDDITFQVEAAGDLIQYQWFWHNQWTNALISGATNAALVYTNAYSEANAGYYYVQVSNLAGTALAGTNDLFFTKPTPVGQYEGLFYATNIIDTNYATGDLDPIYGDITNNLTDFNVDVSPLAFGHFAFSVDDENRILSGTLQNGLKKYSFSGVFGKDQSAVISVPAKNPIWTLYLQLLTTNELPQLTGYAAYEHGQAQLYGIYHAFSAKNPFNAPGKYTMVFQKEAPASSTRPFGLPDGWGYASLTASANGTVTLIGRTADNVSISQSAGLSQDGNYPLYIPTFSGRGLVIGWINIDNVTTNLVTSPTNSLIASLPLLWFKKGATTDANYLQGFAETCSPVGSLYTSTQVPLAYTNAVATFCGGDLVTQDGNVIYDFVKVYEEQPGTFVPETGIENVRLSLNRSTGVITGTYIDCISDKPVTALAGVVLQQIESADATAEGWAAGYFLDAYKSNNPAMPRDDVESGLFMLTEDAYDGD